MAEAGNAGRPNQKNRTRKDLLRAAARLMKEGRSPGLEEIAEEAMVSRATAYRYFSGVEPLLIEAALDMAMPDESFFAGDTSVDPVERLLRVDAAVAAMIRENEPALRAMLVHSLQGDTRLQGDTLPNGGTRLKGDTLLQGDILGEAPTRQNRRTPLIELALAPVRETLQGEAYTRLVRALALVIGTESLLVFKDVLSIGDDDAAAVRRWMIRTLVAAAPVSPANC